MRARQRQGRHQERQRQAHQQGQAQQEQAQENRNRRQRVQTVASGSDGNLARAWPQVLAACGCWKQVCASKTSAGSNKAQMHSAQTSVPPISESTQPRRLKLDTRVREAV